MLTVSELQDTHFSYHDIDDGNLERVARLVRKDLKANRVPARLTTHRDRRAALDGADYVINCTRIGGLEAFATDIDIPLKYGVDQCVGDTLCAGGIMYGQRNIPCVLEFQSDMVELCNHHRPGGPLFLNYANPMAMNTWASVDAYTRGEGIATVGLCHGVEGGWRQIADALSRFHGEPEAMEVPSDAEEWIERNPHRRLVDIAAAGINHQTWYVTILYKGRGVGPEELLAAFESHPSLTATEKVRIDVLRRFGVYSTESNGHLSEYLPWYRKRPHETRDWIDLSSWINGETGGYLRVCTEGRNWFVSDYPRWLEEAGGPIRACDRSSEHGSYIIEALETGRIYRGHFNVRNNGVISNLPDDCIVEAPGFVDRSGIHMTAGIRLPQACAATCAASVNVQRMAVDAARSGDVLLLKQAMLHDPLVGAVCNPEEVWQMTDEMLLAQASWLPQYVARGAIDAARERLATAEQDGSRVALRDWRGAARVDPKPVDTLRSTPDTSIMEADKSNTGKSRGNSRSND